MKDQAFLDYLRMIENAHDDGTVIMEMDPTHPHTHILSTH